ncbi:MAG: AAA family ATPase, partial [Gammaproteobacteria bacterium]
MIDPDPPGIITRIRKVSLSNFRGFKARNGKDHLLDTDAHVVLITGPNGHGKTNLLEALLLLLTGWYGDYDAVDDLISRLSRKDRDGESGPAEECAISADVEFVEKKIGKIELAWNKNVDGPLPMPKGRHSHFFMSDETKDPADRELDARLCGFFQDRVDILFDQASRGRTLRDVFEPLPRVVSLVSERLPRLAQDLGRESKDLRYQKDWPPGRPLLEELDGGLKAQWRQIVRLFRELLEHVPDWPPEPPIPEEIADDGQMDDFARRLALALGRDTSKLRYEKLREAFPRAIQDELERRIRWAERGAGEATDETGWLQSELDAVKVRQDEIRERFPFLDKDLRLFESDAPDLPGLPDALALFQSLARNARRWGEVRVQAGEGGVAVPRFQRVLEQFAAVDEQEASKCAETLEAWLSERRQARHERTKLEALRRDLEARLARSLISEKLAVLKDLDRRIKGELPGLLLAWAEKHEYTRHLERRRGREAARGLLVATLEAVMWCRAKVEGLTAPDPILMEEIRRRADLVLRRFSLVDGFLPLRLKADEGPAADGERVRRSYKILTRDWRYLSHLSTGQRAQVAVSLLVAQNLAIPQYLTHRVILL